MSTTNTAAKTMITMETSKWLQYNQSDDVVKHKAQRYIINDFASCTLKFQILNQEDGNDKQPIYDLRYL